VKAAQVEPPVTDIPADVDGKPFTVAAPSRGVDPVGVVLAREHR
jgi:hypothetical protein